MFIKRTCRRRSKASGMSAQTGLLITRRCSVIFPASIPVFGDQSYRGDCPSEQAEAVAFFAWLRTHYPHAASVATHVRNEGRRTAARAKREQLEGMLGGHADIVIAGAPTLAIEMKRRDHTKSSWQKGQREYLISAQSQGAFVCVGLGAIGAALAVEYYLQHVRTI